MSNKNLYSIILPTFNEKENLPIVTHILNEISVKQYHRTYSALSILKSLLSKIILLMEPEKLLMILSKSSKI